MNAPETAVLIEQFVAIPETTLPGGLVVPAFQVSKYLTSKVGGAAAIQAELDPWTGITYHDAVSAAQAAGFQLIRESQCLALAYQIALQDENWTGGKVGQGKLFQGLRKGRMSGAQPASYVPADADERRWFALPDGQRIYDVAGNAYTWIFDDVQGNEQGLIARDFAADSPSLVIPYPADDKGQGWTPRPGTDWSSHALVRGGYWFSESYAGVFLLYLGWPGLRFDFVGFRCTKPGL